MPNPSLMPAPACSAPVSVAPRGLDFDRRELAELVCDARTGDRTAWSSLVRRLDPTLRSIASSFGLASTDIEDVVQASWLDLLEHIGSLREPAAVAGWLATTARRNAMNLHQRHARELVTDDATLGDGRESAGLESDVLDAERRAALARAISLLPDRHRRLMTVLVAWPTLGYREVGELLSMPVGSIGPIRARSLNRLSTDRHLRALRDDAMFSAA